MVVVVVVVVDVVVIVVTEKTMEIKQEVAFTGPAHYYKN